MSAFHPDLLAEGLLVPVRQALADSRCGVAIGLSFKSGQTRGHEWRFSRSPDTQAWLGTASTEATVIDLRLDLTPVRIAQPLYTREPGP